MTAKEYYEKSHPIDLGIITKDEAIKMMEEYSNQENDSLIYENQQLKEQMSDAAKEIRKYQ